MKATSTYECHVCNHTVHAGDEIYLVGGDLRCEKCSPRINTTQIIPDGGPMRYDRDFAFAETATEANLKITAKRWLPSETTPQSRTTRCADCVDCPTSVLTSHVAMPSAHGSA